MISMASIRRLVTGLAAAALALPMLAVPAGTSAAADPGAVHHRRDGGDSSERIARAVEKRVEKLNTQSPQRLAESGLGWSNVPIGGSGYIPGLVVHPTEPDVVYAKIDIGGVFRWEPRTESWTSLMDFLPTEQWNDYGTESIALDPSDPDVFYVATGIYGQEWATPGKIYRSDDRGESFELISPDWDVRMGGGESRRGTGERLAVSPTDSDTILFASRKSGLWRTTDRGETWTQQNFDGLNAEFGIQSVLFDPKTSGLVYGTFNGLGVQRSTDDGATWQPISGSPTVGMRMALTSVPGELWVSFDEFLGVADGGVAKLAADGTWSTAFPAGTPYGLYNAVAVNPFDDLDIVAAPGETYTPDDAYRSRDGGVTWAPIEWNRVNTVPYLDGRDQQYDWWGGEQAAFVFDPNREGTFWTTNWFVTARSDDMQSATPTITQYVDGQETTVAHALETNASGELISGVADVGGFHHDRGFADYASDRLPALEGQSALDGVVYPWNDTVGLATFAGDADLVYRVGGIRDTAVNGFATSTDGGATWTLVTAWAVSPNDGFAGKPVRVEVSATDPDNIVVARANAPAQYTTDGGVTWADVSGLPGLTSPVFYWGQQLTRDGVDGSTFYFYDDETSTVLRSTDPGATFTAVADGLVNVTPNDRNSYLEATPGVAGELWLALEDGGFRHRTDGGTTWTDLTNVTQARDVAVGKPAAEGMPATLYLHGDIDGERGIWMSLDSGASWTNFQRPELQIGAALNTMESSSTEFGRVFIGTSGRGIFAYSLGAETLRLK